MAKVGLRFSFDEPEGWRVFRDGTRHVFQGPDREELIVSAFLVLGDAPTPAHSAATERAFRNALDAAIETAAHPALVVKSGPCIVVERPPLEIWRLDAAARDGSVRFVQAVARAPGGVMLVTLECPDTVAQIAWFRAFLDGIRVVEPDARS